MSFLSGSPSQIVQAPLLNPEQQALQSQVTGVAKSGLGDVQNYYRNILSNNPTEFAAFAAPEIRRFQEETVPGLSHQFAGMGAGALSSSGFRNAQVAASTDLAERLAQIRANLRQNAAQGLSGLTSQALQPTMQNINIPGNTGFLEQVLPQILAAAGGAAFGPGGAIGGNFLGNWLSSSTKGSSPPYGGDKGPMMDQGMNRGERQKF